MVEIWMKSVACGEPRGHRRIGPDDFILQPLRADFIERTGRNFGGGNAHFLGFRENFFALEAEFLRNVVNTNGHILFSLPPTGMRASPSWLKSQTNSSSPRHKINVGWPAHRRRSTCGAPPRRARLPKWPQRFRQFPECPPNRRLPRTIDLPAGSRRHAPRHRPVRG